MKSFGKCALLIIIVLITACNSEESRDAIRPTMKAETLAPRSETQLSARQIRRVGSLHNEYVERMVSGFNRPAPGPEQELFRSFRDLIRRETNLGYRASHTLASHYRNNADRLEFLLDQHLSPRAKDYLRGLESAAGYPTVSTVREQLDRLRSGVSADLQGLERTALLLAIEVTGRSAQLWMDRSAGGQGLYRVFQEKRFGDDGVILDDPDVGPSAPTTLTENRFLKPRTKNCLRKVLAMDGVSAAGYFVGLGIGAVIPGVNVAIATGVAFAAAWGSGAAALTECK